MELFGYNIHGKDKHYDLTETSPHAWHAEQSWMCLVDFIIFIMKTNFHYSTYTNFRLLMMMIIILLWSKMSLFSSPVLPQASPLRFMHSTEAQNRYSVINCIAKKSFLRWYTNILKEIQYCSSSRLIIKMDATLSQLCGNNEIPFSIAILGTCCFGNSSNFLRCEEFYGWGHFPYLDKIKRH